MESQDYNNNNERYSAEFEHITKETVVAELEKLKLIDDDYHSDDDNRVNPFEKRILFVIYNWIVVL